MASDLMYYTEIFLYGFAWWLIPIIVAFIYKSKLKRHPVECIIYELRGENLVYTRDVAGRFTEPTMCYRLKVAKDSIPIPQYDWVLQNLSKPTNLFEKVNNLLCGKVGTITLFKYGSKQYKPIEVKVGNEVVRKFKEVKDKKGEPIWVTVYEPVNVKKEMSRLDFNVIDWDDINHLTQELRAIQMRRARVKDWIERYGPTIGIAAVTVIFIIAIYYSYEMLMSAGDRYIAASQQSAGIKPTPQPAPADAPSTDNMLNNFIP